MVVLILVTGIVIRGDDTIRLQLRHGIFVGGIQIATAGTIQLPPIGHQGSIFPFEIHCTIELPIGPIDKRVRRAHGQKILMEFRVFHDYQCTLVSRSLQLGSLYQARSTIELLRALLVRRGHIIDHYLSTKGIGPRYISYLLRSYSTRLLSQPLPVTYSFDDRRTSPPVFRRCWLLIGHYLEEVYSGYQ